MTIDGPLTDDTDHVCLRRAGRVSSRTWDSVTDIRGPTTPTYDAADQLTGAVYRTTDPPLPNVCGPKKVGIIDGTGI